MNRDYHQALLLYLEHCESQKHFVLHPLVESSEIIDGDWHLRGHHGLIAIVTEKGNVGCVCTEPLMVVA